MQEQYATQINVETHYIAEQSLPEENQYVFAYTITITNTGTVASKLLRRHWIITNADGKVQEVEGEGVVGEQPHLNPGESYQYTSGTVMETPVGSMYGKYQMVADDGVTFDADIPTFTLSKPNVLH